MQYRIVFSSLAERCFRKLERPVQERLRKAIDALAANPRPIGARKLMGEKDLYRVRSGNYRVVYQVRDRVLLVLVIRIGHRREIYRG